MEITPGAATAVLRGMKSCPMHCTRVRLAAASIMVPVLFPLPGELSRSDRAPLWIIAGSCWLSHGHQSPFGLLLPWACSRCEPSTCCSLLCQGMWFVDPLNRLSVLMTLLGRGSRWPCSSKEQRGHRVLCSPLCMDDLQAEIGFVGGS